MKMKTFMGTGAEGIDRIEERVNQWLDTHPRFEVIQRDVNMCTIGDGSELYQSFVVTLWYQTRKKAAQA